MKTREEIVSAIAASKKDKAEFVLEAAEAAIGDDWHDCGSAVSVAAETAGFIQALEWVLGC